MPHLSIQFDDPNKGLIKSLENRTNLLMRLIKEVNKKKPSTSIVKVITQKQDMRPLVSAIRKIKSPNINITQKDNTSVIVQSLNSRIDLLQKMLRESKKPTKIIQKTSQAKTINIIEKSTNTMLEAFRATSFHRGGMSVIPSPS